jgi:hypothetical protein
LSSSATPPPPRWQRRISSSHCVWQVYSSRVFSVTCTLYTVHCTGTRRLTYINLIARFDLKESLFFLSFFPSNFPTWPGVWLCPRIARARPPKLVVTYNQWMLLFMCVTVSRQIMQTVDLDEITSKSIRLQLETELDQRLDDFKAYIDEEILHILGRASFIASTYLQNSRKGLVYSLDVSTKSSVAPHSLPLLIRQILGRTSSAASTDPPNPRYGRPHLLLLLIRQILGRASWTASIDPPNPPPLCICHILSMASSTASI